MDLRFADGMVTLLIRKNKTDQLCKGDEVVTARTNTLTCPVTMLERYMTMGSIDRQDCRKLFHGITHTKSGESLRVSSGLSYTRMQELLRAKLQQLGYSPNLFGVHSLRAGGATTADNGVANASVPDRLFKRHGHWCSEGAKDGYVDDSLECRLSVSRRLRM